MAIFFTVFTASCGAQNTQKANTDNNLKLDMEDKYQVAIFGSGCFWCTEAIFADLKGVIKAESGYAGGHKDNPTYKEVCTGNTGHAEVVKVTYDPTVITFEELLEVFWFSHDPTTLNRQGADVGTQYRSVIFYMNEEQKKLAEAYKNKLNADKVYENPVVTEITPYTNYFKAENYHQDYFALNGSQPYCNVVIKPKVEKFRKVFHEKLK